MVVIWHDILLKIKITSKYLQGISVDIPTAIRMLDSVKKYMENLRTDKEFEECLNKAREIARTLEIPVEFPEPFVLRTRRKTQTFKTGTDSPIIDPKLKFKVEFYFKILDQCIMSITERFEQLKEHNTIFDFLYDINKLQCKTSIDLKTHCIALQKALSYQSKSDIDSSELVEELLMLSTLIPVKSEKSTSIDAFNYIYRNKLESLFPKTVVALRILLTMPVTVASGERSFSKLKIIKNFYRSTKTQDRLVGLSTISIEKRMVMSLDVEDLINDFATLKARKI